MRQPPFVLWLLSVASKHLHLVGQPSGVLRWHYVAVDSLFYSVAYLPRLARADYGERASHRFIYDESVRSPQRRKHEYVGGSVVAWQLWFLLEQANTTF
jgi:hypothetical protein